MLESECCGNRNRAESRWENAISNGVVAVVNIGKLTFEQRLEQGGLTGHVDIW